MPGSNRNRSDICAALDVGTSKVCCVIARRGADGRMHALGVGHRKSHGVKEGVIADLDGAERIIRQAVDEAEREAGVRVSRVAVNLSGGRPQSRVVGAQLPLAGREVRDQDIKRLLAETLTANGFQGGPVSRELVHGTPISYALDGRRGIRDPRGQFGDRLGVEMHMVTADSGPVRTLVTAVERCHLDVGSVLFSPCAAGLACLDADERELGSLVIDMGAGTTGFAVFHEGEVIHADIVPLGGRHITMDIANVLATPVASARQLKSCYGSAAVVDSDRSMILDVARVGEDPVLSTSPVSRFEINTIIRARIEEIFEHVRARLDDSGAGALAGRNVVLTGGASELSDVAELAGLILNRMVRIGRPRRFSAVAESATGPAFSACVGLLLAAADAPMMVSTLAANRQTSVEARSMSGRVGRWLQEHFWA